MAEWGRGASEHEKHEALKAQAKRVMSSGRTRLEADLVYYEEMADNTSLPQHQRDQWRDLADQVATRLGKNAPPSVQENLF